LQIPATSFNPSTAILCGDVCIKKWFLFCLIVLLSACSTRQISDHYTGKTEQRLCAHSINDLMEKLPVISIPINTVK
jgi:hypothetical protein